MAESVVAGRTFTHTTEVPQDVLQLLRSRTCAEGCAWYTDDEGLERRWMASPLPCPHRRTFESAVTIGEKIYVPESPVPYGPTVREGATYGPVTSHVLHVSHIDLAAAATAVGAPDAGAILWTDFLRARPLKIVQLLVDVAGAEGEIGRLEAELRRPEASKMWRRHTMEAEEARACLETLGVNRDVVDSYLRQVRLRGREEDNLRMTANWYGALVTVDDEAASDYIDQVLSSCWEERAEAQ